MLEYLDYKGIYPTTKLSEDEFKTRCSNFNAEVIVLISEWYTFEELYAKDPMLGVMMARQIYSSETAGEYYDGISSQTSSNTSVTYTTKYSLGDYMWNWAVSSYIIRKYGARYITC